MTCSLLIPPVFLNPKSSFSHIICFFKKICTLFFVPEEVMIWGRWGKEFFWRRKNEDNLLERMNSPHHTKI
jgi:hypothetical protein